MNKNLRPFILIFSVCISQIHFCKAQINFSQNLLTRTNPELHEQNLPGADFKNSYHPPSTIDVYDTVIFDLSQSATINGYTEFPVYFKSDDVIYAFDFSLKYDHNKISYDTIIDLTTYLLDNCYYNPNDSTIRFTSSSLIPIDNNTPLVKVRFDTLTNSAICFGDVHTLKGYLNGDVCSVKLIDCSPLGIAEISPDKINALVFPNPASKSITIKFQNTVLENAVVVISDFTGKNFYQQNQSMNIFGKECKVDLKNFAKGIYILQVHSGTQTFKQKLVIH